jgi:hypothetical protein
MAVSWVAAWTENPARKSAPSIDLVRNLICSAIMTIDISQHGGSESEGLVAGEKDGRNELIN